MSAAKRSVRLLDLPDELLSEVLQHVSVADKQQNVQRCCKRFWHILKQPKSYDTWGIVAVRLPPNRSIPIITVKALLQWLVSRQAGITAVRFIADSGAHVTAESARGAQNVLYALAGALAQEEMPVLVMEPQVIDIGGIPAFTLNALASTLTRITLVCRDFQPQHWGALCSLRNLQKATLQLSQQTPPPVLPAPYAIQSMQLASLQQLKFHETTVEVAPLLAHASGLTALTTLGFRSSSLGTLPTHFADLPQLRALRITSCGLAQLPPMATLTKLVELQLQGNGALTDLNPVLDTRRQLTALVLQGTAPLTEANVDVLKRLRCLKLLDISLRSWGAADYAVLGHLVQMTHDMGCKLIV